MKGKKSKTNAKGLLGGNVRRRIAKAEGEKGQEKGAKPSEKCLVLSGN